MNSDAYNIGWKDGYGFYGNSLRKQPIHSVEYEVESKEYAEYQAGFEHGFWERTQERSE